MIAAVINLPIILMVLNSLQSTEAIIARETIIPRVATLDNYRFLMAETPFLTYLRNSVLTALGATVFSLFCAVFARLRAIAVSWAIAGCLLPPRCLRCRCFPSSLR